MKKQLKIRKIPNNKFELLVYYEDIKPADDIPNVCTGSIADHGYCSITNLTLDDLIELKVLLARYALETKINS